MKSENTLNMCKEECSITSLNKDTPKEKNAEDEKNREIDKSLVANRTVSLKKFVRVIGNKLNDYPSFSLFLGAGCSVYSGIRPASELIDDWKKKIYLEKNEVINIDEIDSKVLDDYVSQIEGYDSDKEYSSLFEMLYDTPSQRRIFIEKEINDKFPSLGYAYMVRLFEEGYFSTIFTTNFDDLANEAFYVYPKEFKRPIVCDEDAHISSITVTSKRPMIIKLHGDYLYDNIRATKDETQSLNKEIKSKLREFAHETGLIVIGYSCGDDSVMSAIEEILEEQAGFKNGIYWCFRNNETIPQRLIDIIKKEEKNKKNFIVRIDGFDELMCSLDASFLKEFSISNSAQYPVNEVLLNSLDSEFYKNSNSEKLKKDVERLKIEGQRIKQYYNEVVSKPFTSFYDDNNEGEPISRELAECKLKEAQGKYDELLNDISSDSECDENNYRLYEIKMRAFYMLHKYDKAIEIVDKLIRYDKFQKYYYLNKSICYDEIDKEINIINQGLEQLPNSRVLLRRKANLLCKKDIESIIISDEGSTEIEEIYMKSMGDVITPYSDSVTDLFDFYFEKKLSDKAEKLVNELSKIDINDYNTIRLNVMFWLKYDNEKTVEEIISYIDKNHRSPKYQLQRIKNLKATVYKEKDCYNELKDYCLSKPLNMYQKSIREIASIVYNKFRNLDLAINCLENALKKEWTTDTATLLFFFYCDAGKTEEAKKILDDKRIDDTYLRFSYWDAIKDWQSIINECERETCEKKKNVDFYMKYTHALLQEKNYNKVKEIINPFLQGANNIHPILVINYEIANYCIKSKFANNNRIKYLIKDPDNTIEIGGYLLQGEKDKAKQLTIKEVEKDYSKLLDFKNMFIFNSPLVSQGFLDDVEKNIKPISSFTKDEEKIIKSF